MINYDSLRSKTVLDESHHVRSLRIKVGPNTKKEPKTVLDVLDDSHHSSPSPSPSPSPNPNTSTNRNASPNPSQSKSKPKSKLKNNPKPNPKYNQKPSGWSEAERRRQDNQQVIKQSKQQLIKQVKKKQNKPKSSAVPPEVYDSA